ncbi:MAG: nucleoside-diphosphate-sugar epimerase [Gammaproteobacteria bacterium]|jgi:nucleoside-diphosphate-sugar epimerase
MPGVVAVTGATGFIGQCLVQALLKNNWQVRALTRTLQQDMVNLQWVIGDLENKIALNELVEDADVIVHCAGQVRGNNLKQFIQTNVNGTENLIKATLLQNTQPRFLLISSLAAREPDLSWYARSKYQGEQVLISLANEMKWSIFRPTAVYGPGDRELSPLLYLTRIGFLPMSGRPDAKFGLIYVDDLVQATIDWINTDITYQKIYELDDGTFGGYDRYSLKIISSKVWGHPVFIVSVPVLLIRCLSYINLAISRIFNYLPMLTPGKVRELMHHDWVCDNRSIVEDTAWQPKTTLDKGLGKTVETKK